MPKGLLNQIAVTALQGAAAARALFARKPSVPVVLGAAVAAARRLEEARLAAGPQGPSPVAGCQYDSERANLNLLDVRELPADTGLRRVAQTFRQQSREERDETRARIDMGELYTLVTFARRCAVLALNDVGSTWPQDGLAQHPIDVDEDQGLGGVRRKSRDERTIRRPLGLRVTMSASRCS